MKKKISNYIESNYKQIVLGSLLANVVLVFLLFTNHAESSVVIANAASETDNHIVSITSPPADSALIIEVVGQVNNPGIYRISKPIMVLEAIDLAGGLSSGADMNYVHKSLTLSKLVMNNEKIYIPEASETITNTTSDSVNSTLININSASKTQLDELPGVGDVTAQKIIDGRPYAAIEDLKSLEGISTNLYNKIVSLITI